MPTRSSSKPISQYNTVAFRFAYASATGPRRYSKRRICLAHRVHARFRPYANATDSFLALTTMPATGWSASRRKMAESIPRIAKPGRARAERAQGRRCGPHSPMPQPPLSTTSDAFSRRTRRSGDRGYEFGECALIDAVVGAPWLDFLGQMLGLDQTRDRANRGTVTTTSNLR
jgi:hypothetical protein